MSIKRKLGKVRRIWLMLQDIYSQQLITCVTSGAPYFPVTRFSLNYHTLAAVINDVMINQRRNVLDFGSGVSTVYLARLFKQLGIDASIVSVDDNQDWIDIVSKQLKSENLSEYVTFVYAPLTSCEHALDDLKWYDQDKVMSALENREAVDMVIVDGPTAFRKEVELSRFPALPVALPYLAEKFSFYLDDTHRHGESQVLKIWQERHGLEFAKVNYGCSMAIKGEYFEAIP